MRQLGLGVAAIVCVCVRQLGLGVAAIVCACDNYYLHAAASVCARATGSTCVRQCERVCLRATGSTCVAQ